MTATTLDLFRHVRKDAFPKGTVIDNNPAAGVLFPDFEPKQIGQGRTRPADVKMEEEEGIKYVLPKGGTSLFDQHNPSNKFPGKWWSKFEIPQGTEIPESLVVRHTNFSDWAQAEHYQIEVRTRMTREAYEAALENFARAAVAKAYELSH